MLVIGMALIAAALFALSAAGQQPAAYRLAHSPRRNRDPRKPAAGPARNQPHRRLGGAVGLALMLLVTPLWLASWALNTGGFVVHAAALHVGSISVVQPLMVTTLLQQQPRLALAICRRRSPLESSKRTPWSA